MIRREEGFTLVELMITMVVFVLVIAAASSIFSSLLNSFKQQSTIIESNIEGVVGLEMLRADAQQTGYGIPWFVDSNGDDVLDSADSWNLDRYMEAAGANNNDPTDPSYYNDGDTPSAIPAPAMQRAPRAILAHNDAGPEMPTGLRSDYLVLKSTCIGLVAAAQKWTYITNNGDFNLPVRVWNDPNEDLKPAADMVIVERPVMGTRRNVLVMAAPPIFSTIFAAAFQPKPSSFDTHLIYGVSTVMPRAPFNRADFYVDRPANMPSKCAPNTGILYKTVMNQSDGGFQILPLLDCVADMQVVFNTDVDNDGNPEWNDADFPYTVGLTAEQIRSQIKGVAVYILAQEGQRDPNFTFTNFSTGCGFANCMLVGPDSVRGRAFDLSLIGPGFANYRWKVYQFDVQLINFN